MRMTAALSAIAARFKEECAIQAWGEIPGSVCSCITGHTRVDMRLTIRDLVRRTSHDPERLNSKRIPARNHLPGWYRERRHAGERSVLGRDLRWRCCRGGVVVNR